MTIIVDLDHTLINTSLLKLKMFQSIEDLGVSQDVFDKTYQDTVSRDQTHYSYNAQIHGQKISEAISKPELAPTVTNRLYHAIETTENLVYEDADDFLANAKQAGAVIILLTRGDPRWQHAKIAATQLRQFADRIVIAPESKGEVLRAQIRPDPQTFFITDNAQEIEALEGLKFKIIQLIRPEGKYQKPADGVPVTRSLHEVWETIQKAAK